MSRRTLISTTHPCTITVNVPTPTLKKTSMPPIVINKTSQPSQSPQPAALPPPQPLSPPKNVKWSRIKSPDDANAYISNHSNVSYLMMEKLVSENYLSKTSIGLPKIYRIGAYLWILSGVSKPLQYVQLKTANIVSRKMKKYLTMMNTIWKKELDKYETAQDAFKHIQKHLTNKLLPTNQHILTQFITKVRKPVLTSKNSSSVSSARKKKKKSKKNKQNASMDGDDGNTSILSTLPSCDWKKRKLRALGGYVDYGLHPSSNSKPPSKRQKLNDTDDECFNCHKTLPKNDKYRCSACKYAMYCGPKCQTQHWKVHEAECGSVNVEIKDIKVERKNVNDWNWYEIIYWFNRVKNGRFNNMQYLNARKHLFIGKIKGFQLESINDITLNMIGINDYNQHQMILNVFAELMMEDCNCNVENGALDMFNCNDVDIPQKYLDPISYELMCDPVVVSSSVAAQCYERECIRKYVKKYNMDPLTQENVKLTILVRNEALKKEIEEWKNKNFRKVK